MQKIPTIFERDWDGDRSRVIDVPTEALHIILAAPLSAWATVKYDGTAVMVQAGKVFKRRTVRKGRPDTANFIQTGPADAATGKRVGWVPCTHGPEDQYIRAAVREHGSRLPTGATIPDGTYEAIGDGIQGNPYRLGHCQLERHGARRIAPSLVVTFKALQHLLTNRDCLWEGIVWWLHDEPVGKIKKRDFGAPWPLKHKDDYR